MPRSVSPAVRAAAASVLRREISTEDASASLCEEDRHLLQPEIEGLEPLVSQGLPILVGLDFWQFSYMSTRQALNAVKAVDLVEIQYQDSMLASGCISRLAEAGEFERSTPLRKLRSKDKATRLWNFQLSVHSQRVTGVFWPMLPPAPGNDDSYGALCLFPTRDWSHLVGSYSRYRPKVTVGEILPQMAMASSERGLIWIRNVPAASEQSINDLFPTSSHEA